MGAAAWQRGGVAPVTGTTGDPIQKRPTVSAGARTDAGENPASAHFLHPAQCATGLLAHTIGTALPIRRLRQRWTGLPGAAGRCF